MLLAAVSMNTVDTSDRWTSCALPLLRQTPRLGGRRGGLEKLSRPGYLSTFGHRHGSPPGKTHQLCSIGQRGSYFYQRGFSTNTANTLLCLWVSSASMSNPGVLVDHTSQWSSQALEQHLLKTAHGCFTTTCKLRVRPPQTMPTVAGQSRVQS